MNTITYVCVAKPEGEIKNPMHMPNNFIPGKMIIPRELKQIPSKMKTIGKKNIWVIHVPL